MPPVSMGAPTADPDVLDPDALAPGVRRLRPDDHFMVLSETDASPMHIGALIILDQPPAGSDAVYGLLRRQFEERLASTPLSCRLAQAPDGYDSDVWADVAVCDLDYHLTLVPSESDLDDEALRSFVATACMERLDLSRAPFRAFVFPRLTGGRCALYLKVHHAVADGIGVQTILRLLSDAAPPVACLARDAVLPQPDAWRAAAEARFERLAPIAADQSRQRKAALAELDAIKADPQRRRARTPVLKLSGPTSTRRSYRTFSLELARLKAIGARLGGTINDVFLALAGTALRQYLIEIDDLPDTPIVVNSARSYRRPEHGSFGNRIVALHPHIATTLADPVERLRAIQASMAGEMARTGFDEAMLGQMERPFGPRDRREKFAARTGDGTALLPGNISLSNVPGPAETLSYGGMRQRANYPAPILGSGRFLNITSRRGGDNLDLGVMADPTRIADIDRIVACFLEALETYEQIEV